MYVYIYIYIYIYTHMYIHISSIEPPRWKPELQLGPHRTPPPPPSAIHLDIYIYSLRHIHIFT